MVFETAILVVLVVVFPALSVAVTVIIYTLGVPSLLAVKPTLFP